MNIKKFFKSAVKSAQKGFTLIELAIVGLFLGILAVFAISQFAGSATDTTKANSLNEASQKLADNWSVIVQQCGVASDITALNLVTNTATGAAAGNLSLLVGNSVANAAYTACINQSGVRPLAGLTSGSAGAETFQGFTATLGTATVNGRTAVTVSFAGVPDNVTLPLYQKLSAVAGAATATTVPAAADTTDGSVRFTTATAGKRTVTLVRVI